MFSNDDLHILYVSVLRKFEDTNKQILNYTTLLSNSKGKYEFIAEETEYRLLALKSQAEKESLLLTKIFRYWKKGGKEYDKKEDVKKS